MAEEQVDQNIGNPPSEGMISRRDFLKSVGAAAVGGVAVGFLGRGVVEMLANPESQTEAHEKEAAEVMREVGQLANRNENTQFWNQFERDLKARSRNFDVYHTATGGDLTRNTHGYDYWEDGRKNGHQDVSVLIIDPSGNSSSFGGPSPSRTVMIGASLGIDGKNLGNVPDSLIGRTIPIEEVQDKVSAFFTFPSEADEIPWEIDHSRGTIDGRPVDFTIKIFEDAHGNRYRAEANSEGHMTATVWYGDNRGSQFDQVPQVTPQPTQETSNII